LRRTDGVEDARAFIGADADAAAMRANPADEMVRRMGRRANARRRAGELDSIGFRILDERLASVAAIQAGCERIAGTPLPFAYTLLVHRTAYIVCLLLPIGLISTAGWATPLFTALIAYTFFGLDALSEELEDPFGTEPNDLALDGLCRVCEISVFEALGETPPKMLPADKFYFS
jgi:putative membrane protein